MIRGWDEATGSACKAIRVLLLLGGTVLGCFAARSASLVEGREPAAAADEPVLRSIDDPLLPALVRVAQRLWLGGEPRGKAAFERLAALGVRVVVSVDGARPDIESAREAGIRYVHIPFGYDGIDREAVLALARVARESAQPIFVHCHHCKHRGPAAAAIIARASGLANDESAARIMRFSGCNPDYQGLWRDVANYRPPGREEALPELREVTDTPPLVQAMARLDRFYDDVALALENKPVDQRRASQNALLIREEFHELGRLLEDAGTSRIPISRWRQAETTASGLEVGVRESDWRTAAKQLDRLRAACTACHHEFR